MQRKNLIYLWGPLAILFVLLSATLATSAATGDPPGTPLNAISITGAAALPAGPIVMRPAQSPTALINDGSFENGPPPASAWTEVTDTGCERIDDWGSNWGVAAKDGTMDFWAGGYCGGAPTTNSVSQAGIPVPATDNTLHFWIISYRPDPEDSDLDQAYLQVNGNTVWTYDLVQANDTYPNWVEKTVSLAAYAGQNVTLKFGANSAGASTGNIRFDFIFIGEPPPRCPAGSVEVTVLNQDFEGSFPPNGWNVVNNVPSGACVWTDTDPGNRTNLTGGAGKFAIADSDYCGSSSTMDTEMWTPALNLTGLTDPMVAFNMDFRYYGGGGSEYGAVDASTDNGATWRNIKTWTADARGPRLEQYAIPGAGDNDVRVRWHYGNSSWDWWWQVDNVTVTACQPAPNIDVDPLSLSSTQPANTTTSKTLVIKNVGNAPLGWQIDEEPLAAPIQLALDDAAVPNAAPNAPVSLALDDGSRESAIGIGGIAQFIFLNRFTPSAGNFPFTLNQVQVYFAAQDLVQVGDDMRLAIYENTSGNTNPAVGSNLRATFDVTVGALNAWNIYNLATPLTFNGPGDVLIGVIALELPGSSYFPAAIDQTPPSKQRSWIGWWTTTTAPGTPTLPPNGNWILIDNAGANLAGNWMVRGYGKGSNPCDNPADVRWLTVSPTSGTTAGGGSRNVTIGFNSTGLAVGTYNANLCVRSNDPDPGPGNGTDLVIVPVKLVVTQPPTRTPTPTSTPTRTATPTRTPTPTATPYSSCPVITDWKGEYWNNETLSGSPALCRNDVSIDFEWSDGSPAPQIQPDHFSARWTRNLTFSAGTYRFVMFHDDGARLFINGQLVLQNWCDNCWETDTVDVPLAAGTYTIQMEMYENMGWAAAGLSWSQLPSARQHLPLVINRYVPPPDAPLLNTITPPGANPSYNITWSTAASATSYVLQRATNASFNDASQVYAGGATGFTASSQGIARYYYRVQARNSQGSSPWSNVQSVDVRWEQEPNEQIPDLDNRSGLMFGKTHYGTMATDADVDPDPTRGRDYFYFDLDTARTVELRLQGIPAGSNYDLYIRPDWDVLQIIGQSINAGNTDEYIQLEAHKLRPGHRYFVQVYNQTRIRSTQPYRLTIQ